MLNMFIRRECCHRNYISTTVDAPATLVRHAPKSVTWERRLQVKVCPRTHVLVSDFATRGSAFIVSPSFQTPRKRCLSLASISSGERDVCLSVGIAQLKSVKVSPERQFVLSDDQTRLSSQSIAGSGGTDTCNQFVNAMDGFCSSSLKTEDDFRLEASDAGECSAGKIRLGKS